MSKRLRNATFTITERQIAWIKDRQRKTGLTQVEIVRRALDEYAERQELKDQRSLFTPEQRQDIKDAARLKNISEVQIIRRALTRELNSIFQRF
ncbi:hypothetical protein F4212_14190 [Candidatus Poribacteria bacterium]|nr:hypothetical protein [Candidatus Poribacteria bacterium]